MAESIELTIATPEKILCRETVLYVQIPAFDGYVGILPRHAPFLSLLGIGVLTCRRPAKPDMLFTLTSGCFEIAGDRVTVLADVAESVPDLDLERARKAYGRAINRLKGSDPGKWDVERARAAMLRALNRIHAFSMISGRSTL
jgi:F-type H+-transporting ATPase subunit epsilon